MLVTNSFISISLYCLVGLVIYYILFIFKNRRFLKFAWNHHGFFWPVLPIVGTSYIVLPTLFKGLPINLLTSVQWIKENIGYPANSWFGSSYYYLTTNPEEMKVIFNHPKCYNKGKKYEILNTLFPNSVLVTPYEKWKRQRKLFQNSYKPSVLKTFIPTFYKQSCKLLEDIKSINKLNDPFQSFCEYSFVNFFLTSAGLKEEKCYPDLKKFGLIIKRIQEDLMSKILDPVFSLSAWLRFFPSGKRFTKNADQLFGLIGDLIKQKHEQHSSKHAFLECTNDDKAMPLFDLVINVVSKQMNQKEIFDEITFFVMAATETSGNALASCFMLLGMHPKIQETLYQEVMNKVGEDEISSDHLPKLKYTEAVINETMRLFPPVPLLQRHVGADVDLGTQVIPEGANFTFDIFHLHRDEKYWPNPLKFDPTRFLPENASKIKPYTYLPFSAGPRDCLGKGQAMALMKTTLANLIRKLKITSSQKSIDTIVLTSFVTMRPIHPIDCQFSPRLMD